MTPHSHPSGRLIGLEPEVATATAAAWDTQGTDLSASAHALSDISEVASGFTEAVRPDAAGFAQGWAALTRTLGARCERQAAALRAAAQGLAAADQASGADIGSVATALGAV